MLSETRKAWVGMLVAFLAVTAKEYFNVDIPAAVVNAIAAAIIGVTVYFVPNKSSS
jgi:hypothetical protein